MDVIDISSSPEADDYEYRRPTRPPPRRKPLNKGKEKAKARTIEIELSTSGSDLEREAARRTKEAPQPSTSGTPEVIDVADGSGADPLAQILEIVPDVDPDFAEELIARNLPTYGANVVETVLHTLLEDRSYPKASKKRKSETPGGSAPKKARTDEGPIDYRSIHRMFSGGVHYNDLALDQLTSDYPDIPKAFLRRLMAENKGFYAPTYLFIAEQKKQKIDLGYIPKKTAARSKGKARAKEDAELEREKAWLAENKHLAVVTEEDVDAFAEGEGIECGCCFTEYPFSKMVQCPDAHLFCSECVTQYASTQLGSQDASILCMDQSGCKHPFPESELRRLLSPKLWGLYERIKQRKDIEAAELEGLEECPFCDYKCVIDNPNEKLFRCGNEETCGSVTCRNCKKQDHLPKSCKEVEDDKHLDGKHQIEEAMTRALMRNCPKCQKGFIKESGCNKMSCPYCHTLSCYICRQIIVGYDHFNQYPTQHPSYTASKKCLLWDSVEARHSDDVKAAAEKALAAYRAENPDVDESEVHVDLPPPPPPPPAPTQHGLPYPGGVGIAHLQAHGAYQLAGLNYPYPHMQLAHYPPAAPIPRVYIPPRPPAPAPRPRARRRR